MIKNNKHSTNFLQLLPPIKGVNNIFPSDMQDNLTAVELRGEIRDGEIFPSSSFSPLGANGFIKTYEFTIDGVKKAYGIKEDGIYELPNNKAVNLSGLNKNTGVIRWDNDFLVLNKGEFYLNGDKQGIYDDFIQTHYEGIVLGVSGLSLAERDGVLYLGSDLYAASIQNGELTGIPAGDYTGLFSYKKTLYCLRWDMVSKITMYRLDKSSGHPFPYFSWNSPNKNVNKVFCDKETGIVYYATAETNGNAYGFGYADIENETGGYYAPGAMAGSLFLGVCRINGEKRFITLGSDNKTVYYTNGGLTVYDTALLPYTASTFLSSSGIINTDDKAYLWFRTAELGEDAAFLYDLTLKTYQRLKFVPYAMTTDENNTIYAAGADFTAVMKNTKGEGALFSRDGRVGIVSDGMITFSGIGDPSNWTSETERDSVFAEAGYKEGGKVTEVVNGYDLIIFKDNGRIYRLAGNYPDWRINTIAESEQLTSNVKTHGNNYLFGTKSGIKELSAGNIYGDYLINNISAPINTADCKFIHISQLRQSLMFVFEGGVYEFKQRQGTWTKITDFSPDEMCESNSQIYALKGGSLHVMNEGAEVFYKYGRSLPIGDYLIKSVTVYASGVGSLTIRTGGNYDYNFTLMGDGERQKSRQISRAKKLQPEVMINGSTLRVNKVIIEYANIGG